jgi:hypothetical protein
MLANGLTAHEAAIIAEQFAYLARNADEGTLCVAGRTLVTDERAFGVALWAGNPVKEGSAVLTGSCHCGAVRIQVPRKPRSLTSCNCSICRRHAGLWGYYDKSKVKIVTRRGALDCYVWGDKCLTLCRCATCGCVTHWQPIGRARNRMGVNFRNFDPSVIESTRVRRLDGAKTWKFLD